MYKIILELGSLKVLAMLTLIPRPLLTREQIYFMVIGVIVIVRNNSTFHSRDIIMTARCPNSQNSESLLPIKMIYFSYSKFLSFSLPSLLYYNILDCKSSSSIAFFIGFSSEDLLVIWDIEAPLRCWSNSPFQNKRSQSIIWNNWRKKAHFIPSFLFQNHRTILTTLQKQKSHKESYANIRL